LTLLIFRHLRIYTWKTAPSVLRNKKHAWLWMNSNKRSTVKLLYVGTSLMWILSGATDKFLLEMNLNNKGTSHVWAVGTNFRPFWLVKLVLHGHTVNIWIIYLFLFYFSFFVLPSIRWIDSSSDVRNKITTRPYTSHYLLNDKSV